MQLESIPLVILWYSIFRNDELTIIDEEMSVTFQYFDLDIVLNCHKQGDDLVIALGKESDKMDSEINYASKRDKANYEHYFVDILKKVSAKTPVNVEIKLHSTEATIYNYKRLEDLGVANLFTAIKEMDMIYFGVPIEGTLVTSKTV